MSKANKWDKIAKEAAEATNKKLKINSSEVLTEDQVKALGYELVDEYDHNQFHTKRYQKGVVRIEFDYEGSELVFQDLIIEETDSIAPLTFEFIKKLTECLDNVHSA